MSDFIDGLEQDLLAAARRREQETAPVPATAPGARRRWILPWSLRTILLAIAISVGAASAAAAATLYTLRGSVIPAPAAADVPPSQTPVPSSAHVSSLRAADPRADVAPWTLRVARSDTGFVCSTVGQVADGRFGLIGTDGRFRELAPGVTDSCGQAQQNAATLVGARIFAAKRPADVRTVISGVAGDTLRRVQLKTSRGTSEVDHADGGTFVAVFAGYPEDVGAQVTLTFADGHRKTEPLGVDPSVVLDPEGGPAWRTQSFAVGNDARQCASFASARHGADNPISPGVCGLLTRPGGPRTRRGFFLAVRRLSPTTVRGGPSGIFGSGNWHRAPARTAVWGGVGDDVRSVAVQGPGLSARTLRLTLGRAVLGVFPASVRPETLRVRVTMKDGTVRTVHGDANLVNRPVPLPAVERRRAAAAVRRSQARMAKEQAKRAAPATKTTEATPTPTTTPAVPAKPATTTDGGTP